MAAAVFDGRLRYVTDYPVPARQPGWALIRVRTAGICRTDRELMQGYLGFRGVLGHEFIGIVAESDDPAWTGRKVVGDINAACGHCEWCAQGLGRHCPHRTTLGIAHHDGCLADYCVLPVANLLEIPATIPDERAILLEPLSAACEILEQMPIQGEERIVVIGDGRLGILCAWALATVGSNVTLLGHHAEKLALAQWRGIKTALAADFAASGGADIVVEATGSGQGISAAIKLCRPRGRIILKSTVAIEGNINLAPIVINELSVIGSRCGRLSDGLRMVQDYPDMPLSRMITECYPLSRVEDAFTRAARSDALKVLLHISSPCSGD
jgi:alcohol dehydrogenase